jgi:hypothetical protein
LQEEVLPVVHLIAGLWVPERIGSPAQTTAPLEDQNLMTQLAQGCPGGESAETASDDHDAL